MERHANDPLMAAVLGLILPGGGHLYGGRFGKALFFFVLIVGTFLAGLFLSGFRAVSYQHQPYWFLGQAFAGLPAVVAVLLSPDWRSVRLGAGLEAGTLYTTVAGLMNVLVIMDAAFPVPVRLLINVPEEEGVGPRESYEALKRSPAASGVMATFPSMNVAVQVLKKLSFTSAGPGDRVEFPPSIQGGVFKTSTGALIVLGGSCSEKDRAELRKVIGKHARKTRLFAEGKEEVFRKPWWKR